MVIVKTPTKETMSLKIKTLPLSEVHQVAKEIQKQADIISKQQTMLLTLLT
jgi:hypothetical protein